MYRSELCIYHTEDRTLSPESQLIYKCMDSFFWKTDPLKEQCHEMDMFFKGLNILISTFCVCADGFQGLSKAFHYHIQLFTF